jgi:hypothetical protein
MIEVVVQRAVPSALVNNSRCALAGRGRRQQTSGSSRRKQIYARRLMQGKVFFGKRATL